MLRVSSCLTVPGCAVNTDVMVLNEWPGPGLDAWYHGFRHSGVCKISFAGQHLSPSGLEVLRWVLDLKT